SGASSRGAARTCRLESGAPDTRSPGEAPRCGARRHATILVAFRGNPLRPARARRTRAVPRLPRVLHDQAVALPEPLPLQLHALHRPQQLQEPAAARPRLPRPQQLASGRCADQQPPLGHLLHLVLAHLRARPRSPRRPRSLRAGREERDVRADGDLGDRRRDHLALRLQPRPEPGRAQRDARCVRPQPDRVARTRGHRELRADLRVHLGLDGLRDGRAVGGDQGNPAGDPRGRACGRRKRMAGLLADHGPDVEPAAVDRDDLALHQRHQGVRHHLRDDRWRPGNVEPRDRLHHVLRDVPEPASGLRRSRRGDHAAARPAGNDHQRPPVPQRKGRDLMATYEQIVAPLPAATRSPRLVRFITRTPLHIALVAIAVIWLIPTFGLLITSFRPNSDILSSGWWTAFSHWNWTLDNYTNVIHAQGMGHAWVNSLIITVPATILPLT